MHCLESRQFQLRDMKFRQCAIYNNDNYGMTGLHEYVLNANVMTS